MPKRILYVEQAADGTVGGSHYCLLYLIQGLDRAKYQPLVVFYEAHAILSLFEAAAPTRVMPRPRFSAVRFAVIRKGLNVLKHLGFLLRCLRLLRRERIEIVHLNNAVTLGFDTWLLAALVRRIPCVTHERYFAEFTRTSRPVLWFLSRRFRKVLAVSNKVKQNLLARGLDPIRVVTVYDGIDASAFRNRVLRPPEVVRRELGIPEGNRVIGLVGNIREWKGQALLVRSLRLVNQVFPGFTCLLVGAVSRDPADAAFADELRKEIAAYGLSEKVILTGYRSDVPDLVNTLDVLINASIKPDPFPHVVLEGMALGKVVIATDLGGAAESVAHEDSGYLVSGTAPEDMAQRIVAVLTDEALRARMQQRTLERVQMFSLRSNIAQTQDIYAQLLERPR